MKKFTLLALACALLLACQDKTPINQTDTQTTNNEQAPVDPHDLKALADSLQDGSVPDAPVAKPIITADGKIQLDWMQIDTKVAPIDPASYAYPFAKDSQPVQNYAKTFNISAEQAQYSMMLSMASPEALGKILDQLVENYRSHEFIDGDKPKLVIHTTANVIGEQHDYVLADKFGEGLVLPIEIRPAK